MTADMTNQFLLIIKKYLLADARDDVAWKKALEKELVALHPNFFQRMKLVKVYKKFMAELTTNSKDELEALLEKRKKEIEEQEATE